MKIDEYKKMYYINKGTHLGNPVKKSIRNMIDYYMDKEFDDWLKKNRPRKHNYRLLIVIEECLERNRVVK